MGTVSDINSRQSNSIDGGGEPPDDGRMEARISKLEAASEKTAEKLAGIEKDVAILLSNYATKSDLHEAMSAQTWKLVTFVCGFGTALVAATYFIVKAVSQ